MYNKHITALCAAIISSVLVASFFAISFVQQQAVAQANQTTTTTKPVDDYNSPSGHVSAHKTCI